MQRAAVWLRAAEEEDLFLDVWCQLQQADDLAEARPAHVAQPGQGGIVLDHARLQQRLAAMRQRQQACQARDALGWR